MDEAQKEADRLYREEKKRLLEERRAKEEADEKSGAAYRRVTIPPYGF